jgi:long-chain acyl-CoA synthetase
MNLALWLERAGLSHGDLPALGFGKHVLRNYRDTAGRAARLAASLRQTFGLQLGDRVAIIAKNCPDYVELMFGIWHAGLAAVPANAKLHGRELGYILEHSGARVCFASSGLDGEIAPYAPATLERLITIDSREYKALFTADPVAALPQRGDDLAWLFYTSGTTGRPKGAMLTHRVLAAASFAYVGEVDPTSPGDVLLHAAPMSHGSGLYLTGNVMRLGVNAVPESGSFEADEVLQLFDAWPRTSMFAAPTMVKRLVECPLQCKLENIRTIVWGGAPMYVADALAAIERFGPRFAQIYGQGESPMTITTLSKQDIADRDHPRWAERLASAGRPYAGIEILIADSDDRALPTGETGEILCRGDVVMPGYWTNPDATAATLRGGWLHTGDAGIIDNEGYVTMRGRFSELIKVGNDTWFPRDIEDALCEVDGVLQASVVGLPDAAFGKRPVGCITVAPGTEINEATIRGPLQAKLSRYDLSPLTIRVIAEFPMTPTGKISKAQLAERLSAGLARPT